MDNIYHTAITAEPLASALDFFTDNGYRQTFRREADGLYCIELYRRFTPAQFNVDDYYFFDAASAPDANRVAYAISTVDGLKGILVDSWGAYADNISVEMIEKLRPGIEQASNPPKHEMRIHHPVPKDNEQRFAAEIPQPILSI